jgi:hypothetical protein
MAPCDPSTFLLGLFTRQQNNDDALKNCHYAARCAWLWHDQMVILVRTDSDGHFGPNDKESPVATEAAVLTVPAAAVGVAREALPSDLLSLT